MTDHNNLIDRTALLRNRTRYEVGRGSFLHDEAISEVQHRLTLINKSFTDIAIVTPQPDLWQTRPILSFSSFFSSYRMFFYVVTVPFYS